MHNLFNQLNFTIGNEDNRFEQYILPEKLTHAVCTAGSGVGPMVVLSRGPAFLSCVDISEPQLYLTELRIESARKLSYEDFVYRICPSQSSRHDPLLVQTEMRWKPAPLPKYYLHLRIGSIRKVLFFHNRGMLGIRLGMEPRSWLFPL